MNKVFNFYLSEIIGKEILFEDRKSVGKLQDIVVSGNFSSPKVLAAEVNFGGYTILVDFSKIAITKENAQYVLKCKNTSYIKRMENGILYLVKHVSDKKIIDASGKKLQRVNDFKIEILSSGAYVIACDISIEGLLRKMRIAYPLKMVFKFLCQSISSKLIPWDEIEKIDFFKGGIKVSKAYSKLPNLRHPDITNIILIEELDLETQIPVVS